MQAVCKLPTKVPEGISKTFAKATALHMYASFSFRKSDNKIFRNFKNVSNA